MALTEKDIEAIVVGVTASFRSNPPCGLRPQDAQELPHLIGMVRDAGDDSLSKGVEVLRDNARFVKKWRGACEKTGGLLLMSFVLGACGLFGMIFGKGFWAWIWAGGK